MMVAIRPGRVSQSNRGPVQAKPQASAPLTFPAPVQGLVTTVGQADAAKGAASILNNWFPTLKGARIRGGKVKRAILNGSNKVAQTMFGYKYGANQKMFVSTQSGIFDISSPAAPPAATNAVVTAQSAGDWSAFQHTTTGGSFLCCFNGANPRQVYDGTNWLTTPAISFSDSTTSAAISYAFLFKQRQFLLKASSMDAYYLGVNAIGGAASLFPLGGVMRKGGALLTGFSWSIESGDGLSDMCVFISSEGEVAVYQGSDPSSANDWGLKGVYQIGRPLGKNAWIRAGGDVLVATVTGLIPLSQVFQRDRETLSLTAVSRPIEDDWRRCAEVMPYGWTITPWPEKNLVFVTFPLTVAAPDITFVLNVLTGRWSTISNWMARCYASYQGSLFFGDASGNIWQGDASGADDGLPFNAVYLSHFLPAGDFGQRKSASLARMHFEGKVEPIVELFARAGGDVASPQSTEVTLSPTSISEWDVGLWDVAKWDENSTGINVVHRQNIRAAGDMLALGCVVTSGGAVPLFLEVGLGVMQLETGEASA